jgi:bifunctional enzyme CysN/CysC
MLSGASNASIAVILVDGAENYLESTHGDIFTNHLQMIKLLGIQNIIVLLNKIDRVSYEEKHFQNNAQLIRDIAHRESTPLLEIIPLSAYYNENIFTQSEKMPWYKGKTFTQTLLDINVNEIADDKTFLRLSLQDVYKRSQDKRIYIAKIEHGTLEVGMSLQFFPSRSQSKIKTVEHWKHEDSMASYPPGASIGFTLTDPLYLERGEIGVNVGTPPPVLTHSIHAGILWMSKIPMVERKTYRIRILHQESDCEIESIHKMFSFGAEVTIRTHKEMACDRFQEYMHSGRFVLIDNHAVVGGGIILNPNTQILKSEKGFITPERREKLIGHKGAILWFTGLSGAGKSTIAKTLEDILLKKGIHCVVLDGDNMRQGLCKDLGFLPEDRLENMRRVAEVAKIFSQNSYIAVSALISPFSSHRQNIKNLCVGLNFFEIYIDCPIEECAKRDPKGLYQKSQDGKLDFFTGHQSDYEPPVHPDLVLSTLKNSPIQCAENIVNFLSEQRIIP